MDPYIYLKKLPIQNISNYVQVPSLLNQEAGVVIQELIRAIT